jgi:hypothetical protein
MGYLGNQITTVFPTSISVDSATISGNASVGGTLGVTGVSTLSDNIVFDASSKGVHLGVTSATASNLLDDFEEGTFDLTVSDATSGGNTGSVTQNNFYTKIGDTVILNINLINITITGLTGATNLYLQGSPFTPNSNSYGAGQAGVNLINVESSCFGLSMFINGGQSYLSLLQNLDDAGSGTTHVNKFNNGNADVFATVIFKV